MKIAYPDYKHTNFREVYKTLSKVNQKTIDRFIDYCSITAKPNSLKKIYGKIVQLADIFDKSMSDLDLEDVRCFLKLLMNTDKAVATKNDTKKILKRFLKWKYEGKWEKMFNKLEDLRCISKNVSRKLDKIDLITADELNIIINNTDSLMYKCLILLMHETAGRPEEILKLKWKDLNLNIGEVKLNSSKTGNTRNVPIHECVGHLERYKAECFFPFAKSEDFVFKSSRSNNKSITLQTFHSALFKIEKKSKLKKHLFPYLFRHTRLSVLIKALSPKAYEKVAGHSLETGLKIYAHLDTDDVREELYEKVYKINELTPQGKNEVKRLREKIDKLEKRINDKINFENFTGELLKNEKIQEELVKILLKKGIGKKVIEMSKNQLVE